MKIFTRFLVSFVLVAIVVATRAQDIHFSQFYASPNTLNAALTGVIDGDYRVGGIYRNQWRSISPDAPFQTYSVGGDMKFLQAKLKKDVFGVGAVFVGDKSGDGKLSAMGGYVSAAYHKGLDKNHKHFLGLGVAFGYMQKSVKYQELTFPNQFNNGTYVFDNTIPNSENISKPSVGYFDMSAGILHQSMIKDIVGIFTGFTVHHLTMPKESFMGANFRLQMRFTVHGGFRIKAMKQLYITPNYLFQFQNGAREFNFGTNVEYHLNVPKMNPVVSVGAWYRPKDAAIVYAGLELYNVKASFAYDINTSALKPATNQRGAFEIALTYTGFLKPKSGPRAPVMVPCLDI